MSSSRRLAPPFLGIACAFFATTLGCSNEGELSGDLERAEELSPHAAIDPGELSASDLPFDLLDILNEECVLQSCDGDYRWRAADALCDFDKGVCAFSFWNTPHYGSFDPAKMSAELGNVGVEVADGRFSTHWLGDFFDEEEGLTAETHCVLGPYSSADEIFRNDWGRLTREFQGNLISCLAGVDNILLRLESDA